MEKWSFGDLQRTCTDAKKKGLLPGDFACATTKEKKVTKRILYDALLKARVVTNTGDLMEQVSRKLPVYVIVHTTNGAGLQQSPFTINEFESPAEGLQGAHNVLGTFTSLKDAYKALTTFISNKKKRDKTMLSVRMKIASFKQTEDQFQRGALSYVAADASLKDQTDYFVIHKSVLDKEQFDVNDIRTRFNRYGKDPKKLSIKTSTYKGVKTMDLVEALTDSLRKEYKKVPPPQFTVFYNPNTDVWYVAVTGIHLSETVKTTSNHIYNVLDEPSEVVDFAQLGLSPGLVETTTYKTTKSPSEVESDLEGITENVFVVE